MWKVLWLTKIRSYILFFNLIIPRILSQKKKKKKKEVSWCSLFIHHSFFTAFLNSALAGLTALTSAKSVRSTGYQGPRPRLWMTPFVMDLSFHGPQAAWWVGWLGGCFPLIHSSPSFLTTGTARLSARVNLSDPSRLSSYFFYVFVQEPFLKVVYTVTCRGNTKIDRGSKLHSWSWWYRSGSSFGYSFK